MEHSFSKYDNSELAFTAKGPISDSDKQVLKYNLRKQDIFEQALFFTQSLFGIRAHTTMCPKLLLQLTSNVLSVVLSHHFQKKDIRSLVEGTSIDFGMVRDTMYKYSKKAEEKFFANPCLAFMFIEFAQSDKAKEQILNKQPKKSNAADEAGDMSGCEGEDPLLVN